MQATISQSVGQGGVNQTRDVETIQVLLNQALSRQGNFQPLQVDKRMGPRTVEAIKKFQSQVVRLPAPDGRVDPNGVTWRTLIGQGAPSAHPTGTQLVTGKTTGVNTELIKYLQEVANHYGKPIQVTSGKRNATEQANAMWGGWNGHLDHGRIYVYLKANETVRKELDNHYAKAHAAASTLAVKEKAKQDFTAKIVSISTYISKHLTGDAVDVSLSTDKKVLGALAVGLHHLVESSNGVVKCHHFDTGKFGRAPAVTAELRAQWPK